MADPASASQIAFRILGFAGWPILIVLAFFNPNFWVSVLSRSQIYRIEGSGNEISVHCLSKWPRIEAPGLTGARCVLKADSVNPSSENDTRPWFRISYKLDAEVDQYQLTPFSSVPIHLLLESSIPEPSSIADILDEPLPDKFPKGITIRLDIKTTAGTLHFGGTIAERDGWSLHESRSAKIVGKRILVSLNETLSKQISLGPGRS